MKDYRNINANTNNPCKDCEMRCMGCHISCLKYLAYRDELNEKRKIMNEHRQVHAGLTGLAEHYIETKRKNPKAVRRGI